MLFAFNFGGQEFTVAQVAIFAAVVLAGVTLVRSALKKMQSETPNPYGETNDKPENVVSQMVRQRDAEIKRLRQDRDETISTLRSSERELENAREIADNLEAENGSLRKRLEEVRDMQCNEATSAPLDEFGVARHGWVDVSRFLAAHGHGDGTELQKTMTAIAGVIDRREDEQSAAAAIMFPNFERESATVDKPQVNPTRPTVGPKPIPVTN